MGPWWILIGKTTLRTKNTVQWLLLLLLLLADQPINKITAGIIAGLWPPLSLDTSFERKLGGHLEAWISDNQSVFEHLKSNVANFQE